MEIVINHKFNDLKLFIESVPNIFSTEGITIYKERNELKSYSIQSYNIVVKRYKKPHFINRIAYTFFRSSKAKRAYEYALKLLEIEVNTPSPIAYIEQKNCRLLNYGYFISVYEKEYLDIREFMIGIQTDDVLLNELSLYIAHFHDKGVLHCDMSPGNILYKKVENHYLFTLIDINRMEFSPSISNLKRFKSFKRLSENKIVLTKIAKLYASAANLDESETIKKINQYCTEF